MLRIIEFLGHLISKNEIVSLELLSFGNNMTKKKVILVTGVTARKRSEVSACCKYAKFGKIMHDMLRTIEILGHHISKNEIVSMELLSFCNKMTRKKVILVMGVTARKWSESECLQQICQISLNYA